MQSISALSWKHGAIEYLKLEEIQQDHQVHFHKGPPKNQNIWLRSLSSLGLWTLPWETCSINDHPQLKNLFLMSNWPSPATTPCRSLGSCCCHQSRYQCWLSAPLMSCRLPCCLLSSSSALDWTNQRTSAVPHTSCPLDPSQSSCPNHTRCWRWGHTAQSTVGQPLMQKHQPSVTARWNKCTFKWSVIDI